MFGQVGYPHDRDWELRESKDQQSRYPFFLPLFVLVVELVRQRFSNQKLPRSANSEFINDFLEAIDDLTK